MAVSIAVAFIGIGIAGTSSSANPSAADRVAESAAPVHDLLLHKYDVDELYDAAIVQPIVGVLARRRFGRSSMPNSSTAP